MADYFLVDRGEGMPRWSELVRLDHGGLGWMDTRARIVPREDGWPLAHVEGDGPDCVLAADPTIAGIEIAHACGALLDPWSDQGWIDPRGVFYGCRFARHEEIANALIRRTVGALEAEGWVRVNPDSFRMSEYGTSSIMPNWRQRVTLSRLGFGNPRPGERRNRPHLPDRAGPAPDFAYVPPAGVVVPPGRRDRPGTEAAVRAPVDVGRAERERLLGRLRAHPDLAAALGGEPEHDRDFGGRWEWMLRFEGFDLGSDEAPGTLIRAVGLELGATAFDQVEVRPWPAPGVVVSPEALEVLAPRSAPAP